jgi:hypothetical protein
MKNNNIINNLLLDIKHRITFVIAKYYTQNVIYSKIFKYNYLNYF